MFEIVGVNINDDVLTHSLLETALDAVAVEGVALSCQNICPHGGDVPAIEPDLYLFDRGHNALAVPPAVAPAIENDRCQLNQYAPARDNAEEHERRVHDNPLSSVTVYVVRNTVATYLLYTMFRFI